jgi:hypothetical protein
MEVGWRGHKNHCALLRIEPFVHEYFCLSLGLKTCILKGLGTSELAPKLHPRDFYQ